MSTESAQPSRVRASDSEREQYASAVREAVGEGRLDLQEGDERLAAVYAAKYRDELRPSIADLPRPEPERPRWDGRPRLFRHVSFVAFIAVVLVTVWAATGWGFFWPVFPLAFLTLGLFRHAMWLRWRARWPESAGWSGRGRWDRAGWPDRRV